MSEEEWKTVRLRGSTYYKLVDLNSLLSMMIGRKMSLSDAVDIVILACYKSWYPRLVDIISDAEKLSQMRNKLGGEMERLEKLVKELK